MDPTAVIRDEQELLAATGLQDPGDLADFLWSYVDGVVYFHDEGIDLQPGFQTESLLYPFTLGELNALAQELEQSDAPLQTAAGLPPTKARQAKNAHDAFAPEAQHLAEAILGGGFRTFAPRAMTSFAWWYEDAEAKKLLAVVAPTEVETVTDEVLAYALAWQHDRDLVLALSEKHAAEVARRLPWIATGVSVQTLAGEPVSFSRSEVLTTAKALKARTVRPFVLKDKEAEWVKALLADPVLQDLDAHSRAAYLSWHHRGLQVLRVGRSGGGLRIEAGVQYSQPPVGHLMFNTVLSDYITEAELVAVREAVAASVSAGGSLTSRQTEHRLQASIGASPPAALGLPFLAREYPGYRGPGRPGYIDFLGCDASGRLHVVETKVGHDPKVILQALDYGIWVQANEEAIRAQRPEWPRPATPQTEMLLDFVLAADHHAPAVNGYLAGQLEVLARDVQWRVFTVEDLDAHPVTLGKIEPDALWHTEARVTSQPVRPRRSRPAAGA